MADPLTDVIFWLPRRDEHALAASLKMCEPDPAMMEALVRAAQEQVALDMPGTRVRVYRWHVWRVVRALHRCGETNTPEGRSVAYIWLAGESA